VLIVTSRLGPHGDRQTTEIVPLLSGTRVGALPPFTNLEKNQDMTRVTGATLQTQADLAITQIVVKLQEVLGQRLTAVVAGCKDSRTVRAWAQGVRAPSIEAERRLRDAFAVVDLLLEKLKRRKRCAPAFAE